MDYFITTIVVIVFIFIVLKKNLPPLLRRLGILKRRKKDGKKGDAPVQPPAALPCTGNAPGKPEHTYFEVLAFSVLEADNSVSFRERISLHLNRAVMELEKKGSLISADYLSVAEVLVIIIRYEA